MIKCILASLVTGRIVSVLAPSCCGYSIRSWLCVFMLCVLCAFGQIFVNETVSPSRSCFCRMS